MPTAIGIPLWVAVFLGAVPLSIPPLPEDPALARIAPAECLAYWWAAGTADPDPQSSNQAEQLLAEPEVQQLLEEWERQLVRMTRRHASGPQGRTLATELPSVAKILLTRPLAVYLADSDRGVAPLPLVGGLVVHAGRRAAELDRSLEQLAQLARAPGGAAQAGGRVPVAFEGWPPVRWARRGEYVIVGVGEGELERIEERLESAGGESPEWLAQVRQELPVERRATLTYVNVDRLRSRILARLGPKEPILELLGLDGIRAVYTSTGLDGVAAVTRGRIILDGEPRGILGFLPSAPLQPADLAPLPAGATAALAVRLDPAATWDRALELLGQIDRRARERFEQQLWEAEGELGIDLRHDVLESLGDTWMIALPPGPAVSSWIGAVAAVKVRDASRLERAMDRLAGRMRRDLDRREKGLRLRDVAAGEHRIYYLQGPPLPLSPSWGIAEGYLLVGLMPQSVREAIDRLEQDRPSLAQSDALAGAFQQPGGPAALAYVDTENLFRSVYPLAMLGIQAAAARMEDRELEWDVALLPATETIARHLVPSVATWQRTSDGFAFAAHQTLPGGGLAATAPGIAAFLVPSLSRAGNAARAVEDSNNLKQLALAVHNYISARNQFPTDVYDEEGHALLSWRVQLLPYLEQAALYEEFRLDEPWDSPHNQALLDRMPDVLRPRSVSIPPGLTAYLALAGEGTVFPGQEKLTLADITDGTSNTLMIVLAAPDHSVPWTKPQDIVFDPQQPRQGLAVIAGGITAAFTDGRVMRLPATIDDETLRRLVFRADGQAIDLREGPDGGEAPAGAAVVPGGAAIPR